MNALNVVFSIFSGVGVYMIFSGITQTMIGSKRRITSSSKEKEKKRISFKLKIESMLYQARAPIEYSEFLATSFSIGLLLAAAIFFIVKGLLVSIVGLFSGMALYYIYLTDRRDKIALEYEKAQPEIADVIAASFRSKGYNLPAVLNQVTISGPEIARDDWLRLSVAITSHNLDNNTINKILTYRNSPGLWRIVEAILQFRLDLERLAHYMDKVKRDLTKDVAIERELITEMIGPRKQLLYVALMPAVLLVIFVLFSPDIGVFYSTFVGQIVMIGVLGTSALIYYFGVSAAQKKMRIRQPVVRVPGATMIEAQNREEETLPLTQQKQEKPLFVGSPEEDSVNSPDLTKGFEGITDEDFLSEKGDTK